MPDEEDDVKMTPEAERVLMRIKNGAEEYVGEKVLQRTWEYGESHFNFFLIGFWIVGRALTIHLILPIRCIKKDAARRELRSREPRK